MNTKRKTLKMPVRYLMNAVLVALLFVGLSFLTRNVLSTYQNKVLRTVGIDPKKLYSAVVKKINEAPRAAAAAGGNSAAPSREDGKKGGALAEFTRDLTEAARSGTLGPVIDRE